MVLTELEIVELVGKPVNSVIAVNGALQFKHKVHVTGEGVTTMIHQLSNHESLEEFHERKQDVKAYTRLLTGEIIDAQSRWKSAQGTTKYYDFGTNGDKYSDEFKKEILSQVWKGQDIKVFINDFLSKAIYTEFNGFIVVEKEAVELTMEGKLYAQRENVKREIKPTEKLKPYIVFKCIDEVHSFKVTGARVEWIIFNYGEVERNGVKVKLFRVIDDVKDYIVEQVGTSVIISNEYQILEHKAGSCPVVRVSTILKDINNDCTITSPIDALIEPLDKLLSQYIDHTTTARKHNFPLRYQRGQKCSYSNGYASCDGGMLHWQYNGEMFNETCTHCSGKGFVKSTPSSVILLPSKTDAGDAFNIDNIAGYVTPELENFKEQRIDIDWWETKIKDAGTGLKGGGTEQSLSKTATEVIVNTKPLEDIISDIIDVIEFVETGITNLIGKIFYADKYKGCEIIYGRKLNLRDENSLLNEIEKSKTAGTSVMHIKTLNEELTYSRFIRSAVDLQRNLILNELEPLIGFTYAEVEGSTSIDYRTKIFKQNFADIVEVFEEKNGAIENYKPEMDYKFRLAEMRSEFNTIIDSFDFKKVEVGQLSEKQADAQAELRGTVGGTQGLISINEAVSMGNMDEETAITIVQNIYGYERSIAEQMITAPTNKPKPTNQFNKFN